MPMKKLLLVLETRFRFGPNTSECIGHRYCTNSSSKKENLFGSYMKNHVFFTVIVNLLVPVPLMIVVNTSLHEAQAPNL